MTRLRWLLRRLSRMYWREVPYRAAMLARALAQSRGWFLATRVPPASPNTPWGRAWCGVPALADAERAALLAAGDRILEGRLDVFGHAVPMHEGIPDWNADPVTGRAIEMRFGLFIDFRHVGDDVDIKYLWEVNRHLWWVTLAQCYALSGAPAYLTRLRELLTSWLDACPYPLGANWSSPVEHGVRLVNWTLVWHLIGGEASPLFADEAGRQLRERWLRSIYQHMRFSSDNYSRYSSANNHLIGEATGVFVAARTWPCWAASRRLGAQAKAILERETLRQFSADGVNLEQAIGYQKFCLQFLLAAALVARANGEPFSDAFGTRTDAAITFIAAMMDCSGRLPDIGDCDDSEVWRLGVCTDPAHGFKALLALGAALRERQDWSAKLGSVGWPEGSEVGWLAQGPRPPQAGRAPQALPTHFEQGGYIVLGAGLHTTDEFRVTFDCGPLGLNRIAGHGHADALSILVSSCGEPLLVDAGTYCYNAAPELRHYFRSTAAHNTLRVDGLDQSEYGGSFLWMRDVNCHRVVEPHPHAVHAWHDGYGRLSDPVAHHRRITLTEKGLGLLVEDWIECGRPHEVVLHWHAAQGARFAPAEKAGHDWVLHGSRRALVLSADRACACSVIEGATDPLQGWVSQRFYERSAAPVLTMRTTLAPKQVLRTMIRACAQTMTPV